jgi:hypothetical protein
MCFSQIWHYNKKCCTVSVNNCLLLKEDNVTWNFLVDQLVNKGQNGVKATVTWNFLVDQLVNKGQNEVKAFCFWTTKFTPTCNLCLKLVDKNCGCAW